MKPIGAAWSSRTGAAALNTDRVELFYTATGADPAHTVSPE